MKRVAVILSVISLSAAALAQSWSGAISTQWDLADNWTGGLPAGGTAQAAIEGWGAEYTNAQPAFGWPIIDSSFTNSWGVARVRGPGLHLTQTGGTMEWPNGSGRSSKGITLQSRPPGWPSSPGSPNDAAHPARIKVIGGRMITDAVGLGVPGGLNSGTYQSDPPNGGGDYTEDTVCYRNWQLAVGDERYGWGRLDVGGDATFVVRPNRYVYPAGYSESTPYWYYESTWAPTADYISRVFDVAIGTNSLLQISDNAKLVAPLKYYPADVDLWTQLRYYAGLIQAGANPHYVSSPRLVAGPGQTLQFEAFPSATNEFNEPYGGYLTVTAVPAPFARLKLLSVGSLALEGLVGREYRIESTGDLGSPGGWEVRTNFTLATSPQTWNDPTTSSNRFYRAVLLPLP
jgi:hypothetical protein